MPIIGNQKTWIANIFWRGSSLLAADPVGREGETWQQGDSQLCCSPVLMSGRCIVWKSWQEATAQVWAHRPTPPPPPPHSSTSPQGLKLSPPVPLSFKLPNISWQRVFLNRDPNPGKRSHLPSLTSGHLKQPDKIKYLRCTASGKSAKCKECQKLEHGSICFGTYFSGLFL